MTHRSCLTVCYRISIETLFLVFFILCILCKKFGDDFAASSATATFVFSKMRCYPCSTSTMCWWGGFIRPFL